MILSSVRIQNYKSITDSNTFTVSDVTCLVGKNESGKTALLQALAKLKPVVATDASFQELEFPRMTYSDYNDEDRPKEVLTTTWELEDSDVEAIEHNLGADAITSRTVTIKKGYENQLNWGISIDYAKIVKDFLSVAGLFAEEAAQLAEIDTPGDLIAELKKIASPSERQTGLLQQLTTAFPTGSSHSTAQQILEKRLPTFLYFGSYELMQGEVSLQQLAQARKANTLTMADRIFMALLEMAGTNVDEIQSISRFESLVAKLEAVSNRLSREIFRYWSQNKHLAVEFRFDAARPEDPPPFDAGYVFRTRIKNNRHGVTVSFDERSAGFVWFFSFLVWFSQVKNNYGENLIILLDEPGLNLHAKAQADLLRYIKERLAPHHQVIYTTHSPFMIDPDNLLAVRTVEDVMIGDDVLGTKVRDDVLATDKETLFPLQAALGYDITQTLFIGKNVLLVEGPSDVLYLYWASDQLRRRKRTPLDRRWTITPAGNIDKISPFVTLFGGNKLHIAALTDFAHGEKSKVQRLRDNALLKAGHVFTVDSYTGQPEADVEDMLGRSLYAALVNKCYKLPKTRAVPSVMPRDGSVRVVKDVERHFATLPATVPEFDHYTPATYLIEHSAELVSELPEVDAALDRFETLFIDLNVLL